MMVRAALFDVNTLSSDEREACALVVPPHYRCCLSGLDPHQISSAKIIAACLGSPLQPLGLVLSAYYEGLGVGTCFCIYIDPSLKYHVQAKEMMQLVEEAHRKLQGSLLDFFFCESDPGQPSFRRLLATCGWSNPQIYIKRYFFDAFTFAPFWHTHPPRLGGDFEIFSWSALRDEERASIEKCYRHHRFNAHVYPFSGEEKLELSMSLGLRYQGEVLGWCLVERIAPDMVKYVVLYVDEDLQHAGCAAALLAASIKKQQEYSVKWSLFEYAVDAVPPSWKHFVSKRLKPYALEADDVYRSWKFL